MAGGGRAGGFSPDGYGRDAGIGQLVAIEPTLKNDRAALARGDDSDHSAQSFGIQLAPHQPPADAHLKRGAGGFQEQLRDRCCIYPSRDGGRTGNRVR